MEKKPYKGSYITDGILNIVQSSCSMYYVKNNSVQLFEDGTKLKTISKS